MTRKHIITALMWTLALYSAGSFVLIFNGDAASGGPAKGYATDISCRRSWWAFGTLWDCTATVVAFDGRRDRYHSDNSLLTPADIGKQVPMTTNRVRRSRTTSEEWGLARKVRSNTVGHVLGTFGVVAVAATLTYLMYRKPHPVKAKRPEDKLDPDFLR